MSFLWIVLWSDGSFMVLWISDVFSGIPLKANADDAGDAAGETTKDIRKLINCLHSRAYTKAIKEATQRGESKARHFSILEFLYFLVLHFLAVYGCLMYLLASMSEELYSVLDIVSVQIFLCVLLLCVFL